MQTRRKIEKADRIIKRFSAGDLKSLQAICTCIQSAQDDLIDRAQAYFDVCQSKCQGRCCRNLHVSGIITQLDFVFILCLDPAIKPQMLQAAEQESLYSADCIFLRDRIGPCMFAPNIRPERCILTFCQDTHPLRGEIKAVRFQFNRLYRYLIRKRPLLWFGP